MDTPTRILIVEDEAVLAEQFKQQLIKLGYTVTSMVASGEMAVQKTGEDCPDLVLMDIRLPGILDGIEAAEQIRTRFNIPVIYLTAHANDEFVTRAKVTKPFAYLLKPVQPRELQITIETALYNHKIELDLKEANSRLDQENFARKQAERELLRSRDNLEDLVEQRTLELVAANEQLYQEVADRKRAEKALKESETWYRTVFEEAAVSLWEQNLSGVKHAIDRLRERGVADFRTYFQSHTEDVLHCASFVKTLAVNKATLRLYHAKSQEELFGRFHDIFCQESLDGLIEGFCAVAENRAWCEHEALNRRLTGEPRNLIVRWTVVPGYEETYERVLVSVFDFTDRKQAEEQLRLLSSAVEQSTEGIAVTDLAGNLLFVNEAFATMHGYTSQELLGRHLSIFHTSEQLPSVEAANHRIRETGEFRGEIWHARRDGSAFPGLMHNSLLRDEAGQPVGMIGTLRDITEQKQREEELQEKKRQLEQLNASKDKFFSIIAHDVKNPLTSFLSFANFLDRLDDLERDEITELRKQFRASAEHLFALLENLLTWSRLQQGMFQYISDLVPLGGLIDRVVELFTLVARQKQVTLTNRIQEEIIVHADMNMLDTVVRNIVSNALKFTKSGGTVDISARCHEEEIVITVSDTGIGIPKDKLSHLFEIGTRTQRDGTAGERGSGLGLILCKEFVDQHDGRIWIESEPGKGTTVNVMLPRNRE